MPNHETDRRAQWATALWEAAEQNTIAEWICCDPINPKHGLCVAGGKALEMLRALIVDDPEAYKPAPLTTVALELAAAVSVPPPAPRADDQTALRDRIRRAVCEAEGFGWDTDMLEPDEYGEVADAVLAVLPEPADRAAVRAAAFDEAAEKLAGLDPVKAALAGQHAWNDAAGIVQHMARQERRMADEEQQPERPRCPHCGLPHDLTPSMDLACASIRASIADHHAAVSGPCVAGEQQNETPEAETPTTTKPAASPSVVDEVVAALQAKAQALSVEAEEEMRRDLEEQAQVWHEAADLARRTGRKAVRNAQPTAKPETDGEGAATRFNWSDIIPAPVDETAQERDRLIDRINRVRGALRECRERGAVGMQYEIAVLEAIGDREPRRGPGPLCHESDPRTLRECALRANHDGDHEDGDLAWPRQGRQPEGPADCNTEPAAGVRQDGAQQ